MENPSVGGQWPNKISKTKTIAEDKVLNSTSIHCIDRIQTVLVKCKTVVTAFIFIDIVKFSIQLLIFTIISIKLL